MDTVDNEPRPSPVGEQKISSRWDRWRDAIKQPSTILAIGFSVGSALFSTFVAPAIPIYYSSIVTARQEKEAAVNRAYDRLQREAESFLAFASAYALAISRDGTVDTKAEQRLHENLISQKVAVDDVIKRVPDTAKPVFLKYDEAVIALSEAVARSRSVETLKEFWERTSDLLVARRDMTRTIDDLRS